MIRALAVLGLGLPLAALAANTGDDVQPAIVLQKADNVSGPTVPVYNRDDSAVTVTVENQPASDDLFHRDPDDILRRNYNLRYEKKLAPNVSLFYGSQFNTIALRDIDSYDLQASSSEVNRIQSSGMQYQAQDNLSFGAAFKNEVGLRTPTSPSVSTDAVTANASYGINKNGKLNLTLEDQAITQDNLPDNTIKRQAFQFDYSQGLGKVPLTPKFATRFEQDDNPLAAQTISRSPRYEGSVLWQTLPKLAFTFGVTEQEVLDRLGQDTQVSRGYYAEWRQTVTPLLSVSARADVQDHRYFSTSPTEDTGATLRIAPSVKVNDAFSAKFEISNQFSEDTATKSWTPAEQRVSFSLQGSF